MSTTNLAVFQEKFIKEVNERGVIHVLEWIAGYARQAAEAQIQDEIKGYPEDLAAHHFLSEALAAGRSINNKSTSVGSNMMLDARLSVLVTLLKETELYDGIEDARRAAITSYAATKKGA